ncbi:UNVERIFIED_CONTAM: Transcription factor DUO1 [Sesamum radiatum]|uniref:Transcription factor DUO1 n=1 Tax=Sesamum radiatum TaxID=300843 RepID=A0AAW2KQ34_SESRA
MPPIRGLAFVCSGVKFSAEEERTVIDLQAQFGNKWARIATYLPGRTDNDVKNFWSSRQKRLARILQTSSASSSTNSHKSTVQVKAPAFLDLSSVEAPKFSSSTDEDSAAKSQTCSSLDDNDTIKMVPFQDLVYPSTLTHEQNTLQLDYDTCQKKLFPEQESHLSFPQIPQLQPDFSLALESQDFVNRLGDPNFLDEFEPPCFVPDRSCQIAGRADSNDTVDLDTFISDFPPIDLFDDIEPLPSPSEWP